ncbi:hypothetical protein [Vibrio sonorensis]|uniref:hypothetical protein n=1 Tax=Vibrio sonorensis TaxID=1004316 RepID=UPI0008DAA275|nr:hypothetical protein [Vibrio sonorensis]
MNNDIERDFNLGGSIEKALSGDYKLNAGDVLKEAWGHTVKHFVPFSPAIVTLVALQLIIFYIALKLQLGNPGIILDAVLNPDQFNQGIVQAIMVAQFSYEVISAPIYAGISLMAMSHAAGLATKPRHITKGLQFTIPVIIATLVSLTLQTTASMFLPFVSMYLSLAFSQSILLICEKQVPPMQALLLSLRAVNKKIIAITGIYIVLALMLLAGAMMYGIGLVFVVPFFFHVKGVLYRNMFGIKLKIVAAEEPKDDDNDDDSQVFNA